MKRLLTFMVIFASILFVYSNAESAVAGIGEGSQEIGGMATLMNTSAAGTTTSTTIFMGSYAYFFTDNIQAGGSLLTVGAKSDDIEASITGIDLFGKYYFYQKGQEIIPWVGIQAGNINFKAGSTSSSATSYGLMGGGKYFVSENVSANAELNYRSYTIESVTTTTTALLFGFSVYWQ